MAVHPFMRTGPAAGRLLAAALTVLLFSGFALFSPAGTPQEPGPSGVVIGEPAPEIEGATWEGKPLKLSSFRGRVVVLSFWGDW